MTQVQVTDAAGKTLDVMELDGRMYPRFDLESLQNVFTFKARHDDILLATYPKSGTHWSFQIIRYLLEGTVDIPIKEKVDTMIERTPPSSVDQTPSPRNLNSHYHFETLSPDLLKQKCKMIYITRDPRDVAASYFNHHKKLPHYYNYEGEWKDYFHLYLDGKLDYGSWFEYTKGWEKGMKENPDHPFLVISYEAMKLEPLESVKKFADFLGVEYSEELLRKIVERTSISAMKKERNPEDRSMVIYRKGQIGDWKNYFTVAQSELFNQKFEQEMAGTHAYQLYSHTIQKESDGNMNSV